MANVMPDSEPTVRYTLVAVALPPTPSAAAWVAARNAATPNGTYEFSVASAIDSLHRIGRRKKWQQAPERGTAVIRTWQRRHPSTLTAWLQERASCALTIDVPADAPPTWVDVVTDLVERRAFLRMTCPHCAKDYAPSDLRMERLHAKSEHFESAGRRWCCPGGHVLFDVAEWAVHRTERAESSWSRDE